MKNIERLKEIASDASLSSGLRKAAKEQLWKLGITDEEQQSAVEVNDVPPLSPWMIEREYPSWRDIADPDPEVLQAMQPGDPSDPYVQMLPSLFRGMSRIEAKVYVARRRRFQRLHDTITDDSLPMAERVAAAEQWKATANQDYDFWCQFAAHELPERMSPHPHRAKLEELYETICNSRPAENVDEEIKRRLEAIREFKRLREEYPKRREGVPLFTSDDPAQRVAYWARMNDPQHGVSRDTYSHVLRLAGWRV